jgi:hypothetical protein
MLAASELADAAGLKLPFDHTRILREYRAQVPLEFDFEREARMLETLGRACEEATEARVAAPAIARGLCAPKMLAMRFVEGEPLGTLINRAVAAAGASSAPWVLGARGGGHRDERGEPRGRRRDRREPRRGVRRDDLPPGEVPLRPPSRETSSSGPTDEPSR